MNQKFIYPTWTPPIPKDTKLEEWNDRWIEEEAMPVVISKEKLFNLIIELKGDILVLSERIEYLERSHIEGEDNASLGERSDSTSDHALK